MTVLDTWFGPDDDKQHYRVNAGLYATVTSNEARNISSYEYRLRVAERVAPLVWLAMPGHERPQDAPTKDATP